MTRILLIRHGNTDFVNLKLCGRLPGISLNAAGIQQSESLGHQLRACTQLKAIYSSPLERAAETASIIAELQKTSARIKMDERLTEIEFGDWTGLTFQSLHANPDWRRYNMNRSLHAAPRGESLMHVQSRAWECLSEITREHGEASVAVVTHADVIRALLVLFLGIPLDHLLRIELAPASLTTVLLGGDYPVVSCVNYVCSFHSW